MPFDVTMPDGTVFHDIPEGTTKQQILDKFRQYKIGQIRSGYQGQGQPSLGPQYATAHEQDPSVKEGSITPPNYAAGYADVAAKVGAPIIGGALGAGVGSIAGAAGTAIGGGIGSAAGTAATGGSPGEIAASGVMGALPGAGAMARGAEYGATFSPSKLIDQAAEGEHPLVSGMKTYLGAVRNKLSQHEAAIQNTVQSFSKPGAGASIVNDLEPTLRKAYGDAASTARMSPVSDPAGLGQSFIDAGEQHLQEIKRLYGQYMTPEQLLEARRSVDRAVESIAAPGNIKSKLSSTVRNLYNTVMYDNLQPQYVPQAKQIMENMGSLLDKQRGAMERIRTMQEYVPTNYLSRFAYVNPKTAAGAGAAVAGGVLGGIGGSGTLSKLGGLIP